MTLGTTRFALVGVLVLASHVSAAVVLPRVLSSHMVLQRNAAVPIWRTASPGEAVTVTFRNQHKATTADAGGKWMVKLDSMQTPEASSLVVKGSNTVTFTDVLVGEVWVGSGQSNLDTHVPDYVQNDALLAKAASQSYLKLRIYHSEIGSGWQQTTPEALRQFSAQLFYFGMVLQKELDCPVGVMEGAVRGSPAANWIPDEVVKSDAEIQAAIADWEKYHPRAANLKQHEDWAKAIAALPPGTPADKRPQEPWLAPLAGSTNGPRGDFYAKHIRPMQPLAIRGVLWDQGAGGTNIQGVDQDVAMRALIKCWRKDWGQGNFPFIFVQKPSGGGCAFDPANTLNKGADAWIALPPNAPQSYWDGAGRWQQVRLMEFTNTYMTISTDLATGVHPPNKAGYATRDAQVALGAVYGQKVEYYGPLYKSVKVEGNKLRLTFTHVGEGLVVPQGQKLQGFTIAGEDKRFYWADAVIDGNTVVLSSLSVPKPVAARYAWAWDIRWANLFNKAGLPAIMFRTDAWW